MSELGSPTSQLHEFRNPLDVKFGCYRIPFWLTMPPRIPATCCRALYSPSGTRFVIALQGRCASTSTAAPEVYDVVCVGGGPAGLSLLTGLRASPVTSGLKVALIEGQDLFKNKLPKDAPLDSFSNRCSSLTPASVRNLQGTASHTFAHCEAIN